jgi:hypothetical protein
LIGFGQKLEANFTVLHCDGLPYLCVQVMSVPAKSSLCCATYPTPVPDRAHSSATSVKVQTLGRELLLAAICCPCQLGATESVLVHEYSQMQKLPPLKLTSLICPPEPFSATLDESVLLLNTARMVESYTSHAGSSRSWRRGQRFACSSLVPLGSE